VDAIIHSLDYALCKVGTSKACRDWHASLAGAG
jgi:hypothetical protein